MKNEETWRENYEALKAYVAEKGHFPQKHTRLLAWVHYQRKRMKAGRMTEEQRVLFQEVADSRNFEEHCGGRRKKITMSDEGQLSIQD